MNVRSAGWVVSVVLFAGSLSLLGSGSGGEPPDAFCPFTLTRSHDGGERVRRAGETGLQWSVASPARPGQLTLDDSGPSKERILPLLPAPAPADRLPAAFRKAEPASIEDLQAMERHLKELVRRVSSAVVEVEVGDASGSGVVISKEGLVLSAAHVCGRPDRPVRITFPGGKRARGRTLGTNHDSDTGLMKISGGGLWPYVEPGDLAQMHLGDWVVALGHPGGFDAQRPVVARLGRIISFAEDMVQSDCTLIGGDSGGPLFDLNGRVIAIHSYISESTVENFHIPINAYYAAWSRLAKGEDWGGEGSRATQPYVGATCTDSPGGCRLDRLDENGPAARGGLKVGDIVTKIDGVAIKDAAAFRRKVRALEPRGVVPIQVQRGGKEMAIEVTVGERASPWRFRP